MKKAIFIVALCLGTLASAQTLSMDLTKALKNDDTTAINSLVTDSNKDTCYEVGKSTSSLAQLAIQMDSADVLQFLITQKNIDINNTCNNMTPLMTAVQMGRPHLVSMLLDAGADRSLKLDGKTAMDYATGNNAAAIQKLLK
ncbi:ankyrin repeat domain-containing protein [Nonlabens ulvanivorans]|uniref:ankyrin repeat domain-containing protein n=1 Tax=Nonlabens ulvanivorans TaxID=906888 RepID=UPI002943CC19|nr:ankyrin repeat domain-containing protein [Nonlabens ulvanivorans]WOI22232.1 ankyrin repeat domain-containing protein [Nonlabens ulvanivorans]